MSDEALELLNDIHSECLTVREFVEGHTFESYCADKKTRFAVERCFEIIGEALIRLSRVAPDKVEAIRGYRDIRSFRNILAHAYDHVEDRIVWGIIQRDLDRLIEDVQKVC